MFISETVGSLMQFGMQSDDGGALIATIMSAVFGLIGLAVGILIIASWWKIFVKAGEPGWAAIVPFYNLYTMVKISGRPLWVLALYLPCIPAGPLVANILVGIGVAQKFGKSQGFGIGLGLLGVVFYPMLAFSNATYNASAGVGMPGMPGGMPGGMNPYGGQAPGGYGQPPPAGGYGGPPQGAPPGGGYGGPPGGGYGGPPGGMPPGGGYGGPGGGMPPGGGYGGPPGGGGYPPR